MTFADADKTNKDYSDRQISAFNDIVNAYIEQLLTTNERGNIEAMISSDVICFVMGDGANGHKSTSVPSTKPDNILLTTEESKRHPVAKLISAMMKEKFERTSGFKDIMSSESRQEINQGSIKCDKVREYIDKIQIAAEAVKRKEAASLAAARAVVDVAAIASVEVLSVK